MSGKLYVVGTPIGNLGDFSERARQVLSSVDFIAAEDTRVTVKLLNHFKIKTPLISYHEHNKVQSGHSVIQRLMSGETAALVTDAGMPAISDPGEDLVRACHENGVAVESVPGPSALITALAISGAPSGRFCFEGFLTVNKPGRREHLDSLKNESRTMIFYEAPHKLSATLRDMLSIFGERDIVLLKELTKLHETVWRTTLSEAVRHFENDPPRGEYVLIVCPPDGLKTTETPLDTAVHLARDLVGDGLPASTAARRAAVITGCRKNDIYRGLK